MTSVLVQVHALEGLVSTVMIMPTPLLQDATSVVKHRAITMEGVAQEILEELGGLRKYFCSRMISGWYWAARSPQSSCHALLWWSVGPSYVYGSQAS